MYISWMTLSSKFKILCIFVHIISAHIMRDEDMILASFLFNFVLLWHKNTFKRSPQKSIFLCTWQRKANDPWQVIHNSRLQNSRSCFGTKSLKRVLTKYYITNLSENRATKRIKKARCIMFNLLTFDKPVWLS